MGDRESIVITPAKLLEKVEDKPVRKAIQEIFTGLHPRLQEERTSLAEIFTPESASQFLQRLLDVSSVLSVEDDYEETLAKLQAQIDQAETLRDEVLAKLYDALRPLERSYQQLWLFFENSVVPDGKQRSPVELYIYDADTAAIKDRKSATLEAMREFVTNRNDDFNFRNDICNLVIPGDIPMMVREALEEEAYKHGMLMITDLSDMKSYKEVVNSFRTDGGRYEFLKRPLAQAASDVATVGYVKLRDAYWFEKTRDGAQDLYAPASVSFAGALARTDRTLDSVIQGPVGSKFGQIKGVESARVECLVGQMEHLSMDRQVIPIIRDENNRLCFYGCRALAEDRDGVLKFFGSYRVLMYLERTINVTFKQVAGQILTRKLLEEQIEKPIRKLLNEQKELGTLIDFDLFVDKSEEKRMMGKCDVTIEVLPTGPGEVFTLEIQVPDFKADKLEKGKGN
jgi:hypothetical protein